MNEHQETGPTATEAGPGSRPLRSLTRSSDDVVVSGLCGGLGRHFGIDPLVFRIAFIVLALAGGTGVVLYLLGWVFVPDDRGQGFANRWLPSGGRGQKLLAAALAACGLLLLMGEVFDHRGNDVGVGLVLVGVGAAILWSRRSGGGIPPGGAPGGSATGPPPAAPPGGEGPGGGPPGEAPPASTEASVPPPVPTPASPSWSPRPARPPSYLVQATLGLLAILAGVLLLVGVDLVTGLALCLLLVAGALVVGAWRGRARLLIPLGLALSCVLLAASVVDVPLRGGTGQRVVAPVSASELRSPYRLSAGELRLDLRQFTPPPGRVVAVVASVGLGELDVVVPRDAAVEVEARAGMGDVSLFGERFDGVGIDRRVEVPGREGGGRLDLDLEVGVGEVEVRRAAA